MADNKHCPEHTQTMVKLARIDENVEFIKKRLEGSWADVKWLVAIVPGLLAIWMKS